MSDPKQSEMTRWLNALLQSPKSDPEDRRKVLLGLGAAGAVGFGGYLLHDSSPNFEEVQFDGNAQKVVQNFPNNFRWGVYSQSYEVEGATAQGGRGISSWDAFVRKQGTVRDGMGADRACNFYESYEADIQLAARLGVQDFRVGISWSRLLPYGDNRLNLEGINFYSRVIRQIEAANMRPWVTLHYRDMPLPLGKLGGWSNRDSIKWFMDLVQKINQRLGTKLTRIVMADDPIQSLWHGYGTGKFAPGYKSKARFFNAVHNMNIAIAEGIRYLRETGRKPYQIGVAHTISPTYPISSAPADLAAKELYDRVINRSMREPLDFGTYPEEVSELMKQIALDGDMDLLREPVDFVSLNYHGPVFVGADPNGFLGIKVGNNPQFPQMVNGETIAPVAFNQALMDIHSKYPTSSIYVTHLGYNSAYEKPDASGIIRDSSRVQYLATHLQEIIKVIGKGVRIQGVMVPFMDGFKWENGYTYGDGLVGIDRTTLDRLPKQSFNWFEQTVKANGIIN